MLLVLWICLDFQILYSRREEAFRDLVFSSYFFWQDTFFKKISDYLRGLLLHIISSIHQQSCFASFLSVQVFFVYHHNVNGSSKPSPVDCAFCQFSIFFAFNPLSLKQMYLLMMGKGFRLQHRRLA